MAKKIKFWKNLEASEDNFYTLNTMKSREVWLDKFWRLHEQAKSQNKQTNKKHQQSGSGLITSHRQKYSPISLNPMQELRQ